jgi:hypothetical protein
MKRMGLVCLALGMFVAMSAAQHGHQQGDHGRSAEAPGHVQQHRSAKQQRDEEHAQRDYWQHHRDDHEVVVRSWHDRGGYHGGRIPVEYYRVHYGPTHVFRVYREPFMVVGGAARFQYGGFWFGLMEPAPAFWGPSWYETDNVYVVQRDDGYYLYNARFPRRPGIAISVVF